MGCDGGDVAPQQPIPSTGQANSAFLDELVARKIVAGVVERMFFLGAIVA